MVTAVSIYCKYLYITRLEICLNQNSPTNFAEEPLMESLEHLNTALDEDLLSEEEYKVMREQWNQVRALLSGYISYLQKLAPKDRRFS